MKAMLDCQMEPNKSSFERALAADITFHLHGRKRASVRRAPAGGSCGLQEGNPANQKLKFVPW
jgi:hypothetical protein